MIMQMDQVGLYHISSDFNPFFQLLAQAGATVGISKPTIPVDPLGPRLLSLTAEGIDSLFDMSVQVVNTKERFVRNGSKGRFA